MSNDNYVYIKVKLYLKDGQTEESVQNIVQELDYSFYHEEIEDYEVKDIYDMQVDNIEREPTEENLSTNVGIFPSLNFRER